MIYTLIARFKIVIAYIVITLVIGEFHPFSKFPMFSSFPPHSEYYYLADENNQPIYGLSKLSIYSSEISDMIEIRTNQFMGKTEYPEKLSAAGQDVLRHVIELNSSTDRLKQWRELKLFKREFEMENGAVIKKDILLSQCRLN